MSPISRQRLHTNVDYVSHCSTRSHQCMYVESGKPFLTLSAGITHCMWLEVCLWFAGVSPNTELKVTLFRFAGVSAGTRPVVTSLLAELSPHTPCLD